MKRLLVPLLFGVFVLIPPQTWCGATFNSGYTGSFWEYLASGQFLVWNIQNGGDYYGGFGLGHLWFILYLFVISLVTMPLVLWARSERGRPASARWSRRLAGPAWWWLPPLLLLVAEGLPDLAGKNPFTYMVWFLLGFAMMGDEPVFGAAAERARWAALAVGAVLCAAHVATSSWRDALPDPSPPLALAVWLGLLGAWLVIVGLIGVGKRSLDRPSPALAYLSEASYPVYILHQTVIVVAAFYLVRLPASWPVQWLAVFISAVVATFAIYELVRRTRVTRFLFGMRPAPRPVDEESITPR